MREVSSWYCYQSVSRSCSLCFLQIRSEELHRSKCCRSGRKRWFLKGMLLANEWIYIESVSTVRLFVHFVLSLFGRKRGLVFVLKSTRDFNVVKVLYNVIKLKLNFLRFFSRKARAISLIVTNRGINVCVISERTACKVACRFKFILQPLFMFLLLLLFFRCKIF